MKLIRISCAAFFIGFLSASAVAQVKIPPITAADEEYLRGVTKRGMLLAQYDAAAWQGTDAVMQLHPSGERAGTYIAYQTDQGWNVDFGHLNAQQDVFLVGYRAEQQPDRTFKAIAFEKLQEERGWITGAAKALTAAHADFGKTNRPYNFAVLPAPTGEFYVYFYPAQTRNDVYPFGGDVRYRFSADGRTQLEKRRMHQDVLEFRVPKDAKPERGFHIHILSTVPEDTDVFMVFNRRPRMPESIRMPRNEKYGDEYYLIDTNGSITHMFVQK